MSEPAATAPLGVALLVVLGAFLAAVMSMAPPAPLPLNAPPEQFSGLRAAETLSFLLGDETPHPVGSEANRAVRDRLIASIRQLGLEPQVQKTVGCSGKYPLCANVENVLAEIPGTTTDAVVVMAHYDSVPHAPGAADDGSGVVTLLESARALVRESPRRNRILLVFTDAEEMGLLGAEGFFAEHPWVADVKAVINIEGAGSGGPSLLLRSSSPGGHLLDAYRNAVTRPQAVSYSQEVFARMPNDTDFTVSDRAGIPSIDFAFAFEFNHYHTPLDTVANLDKGTLQHHGSNVLPLVRSLAESDLNIHKPNFSYVTLAQSLWVTWPTGWTVSLALIGLVILAWISFRLRNVLSARAVLGGVMSGLVALTGGILVCFGALWLVGAMAGTTVSFPADPWPWRLATVAAAFLPIGLIAWWLEGRLEFWPRLIGVWGLLSVLALVLAIFAPLAANLLIIPVLVAGVSGLFAVTLTDPQNPRTESVVAIVAAAALAFLMGGVAYAMEETQGWRLAPAIFIPIVLITLTLLPLASNHRPITAAALIGLVSLIWVAATPLYSEWRPQHVSFYYVEDLDNGTAQWSTIAANPLPRRIIDAFGSDPEQRVVAPWATERQYPAFDAPAVGSPAPEVSVHRDDREVLVRYKSNGSGDFVQLVLPAAAGVDNLHIAGVAVDSTLVWDFFQARLFAVANEPVEFAFTVSTDDPVEGYIVDGSHTLPDIAAPIQASRGRLAVPQHQGDQRLAFQRIRF